MCVVIYRRHHRQPIYSKAFTTFWTCFMLKQASSQNVLHFARSLALWDNLRRFHKRFSLHFHPKQVYYYSTMHRTFSLLHSLILCLEAMILILPSLYSFYVWCAMCVVFPFRHRHPLYNILYLERTCEQDLLLSCLPSSFSHDLYFIKPESWASWSFYYD